jgi:hypothetical protein
MKERRTNSCKNMLKLWSNDDEEMLNQASVEEERHDKFEHQCIHESRHLGIIFKSTVKV